MGAEFYRPVDTPLGWTAGGTRLVYLHEERYSQEDAHDVTCGNSGIYDTDGRSPPRPLVTGPAWCDTGGSPALAADGRTVVSARGHGDQECGELRALDLPTRAWSTLARTCAAYLEDPVPSPTGDVVAVRLSCGLVSGGGERTHFTPAGCRDWPTPAWRLMRLDGTGAQPFGQKGDREVAWAPDGRRVAVTVARGGGGIDVVERASGRRARLADGVDPAWSPDGRWIAFVHFDSRSTVLRVIGADGSGGRVVFTNRDRGRYSNGWGKTREGMPSHPVWSPDGRRLVFVRNYRTGFTLWSVDVDGRNLRRIAPILPPGD